MGSNILIPLLGDTLLGDWVATGVGASSAASPLIVEVEEDRAKVWVKGARWVSFNSELDDSSAFVPQPRPEDSYRRNYIDRTGEGNFEGRGRPTEHTFGEFPRHGHEGILEVQEREVEEIRINRGRYPI